MKISGEELENRLQSFKTALDAAGAKHTRQRLEIFREVASSLSHPGAEEVFKAVRSRLPSVSLDTVYRTLWFLKELGVIRTVGPKRETINFDGDVTPHHHYMCSKCGCTFDLETEDVAPGCLPKKECRFGSVSHVYVEVTGVCRNCMPKA
jgi:Fur family transcriptional regulator, peroxide stress response regulator